MNMKCERRVRASVGDAGGEGRASARPRASRRLPLPVLREPGCRTRSQRSGGHAAPLWKISASLRLCVKKRSTLNHLRHLCHLWMKPETRNPKPTLCVSAVKWSLPLLLAATCAYAVRDPFWPIGYEPPKPEPEVVEQPAPALPEKPPAQEKPKPPPPPPITEDDWKAARDLFTVSGFAQSKNPVSGETRTLAMINRVSYTVGDTLTVTNDNIHFIWSIESLADLTLKLKPVRATRLLPTPLPAQ